METIEQRTGVYEIQDQFTVDDRNKMVLLLKIILIGLVFFSLTGTSLFFFKMEVLPKTLFIMLQLTLAVILGYYYFSLKKKLVEEIMGVVLRFDETKKVIEILVRQFQVGKNLEFNEQSIRFNQAIGFKSIIDVDGDIQVELIVDTNFPGTPIFRTYDMFALAELILLFQLTLPNLKTWIYRTSNGEDWDDNSRKELNNETKVAKVPWVIREFFK